MKEMYVCERCGKMFANYNDCYDHERQHRIDFSVIHGYELPAVAEGEEPLVCATYCEEHPFPETIAVKFPKVNDEGCTIYDEEWNPRYDVREYTLVSPKTACVESKRSERERLLANVINTEMMNSTNERKERRKEEEAEQDTAENNEEEN